MTLFNSHIISWQRWIANPSIWKSQTHPPTPSLCPCCRPYQHHHWIQRAVNWKLIWFRQGYLLNFLFHFLQHFFFCTLVVIAIHIDRESVLVIHRSVLAIKWRRKRGSVIKESRKLSWFHFPSFQSPTKDGLHEFNDNNRVLCLSIFARLTPPYNNNNNNTI